MSYFTETFESILEFKGDTDSRDLRDKMSGDHTYGGAISKAHGDFHRSEDVRNMKDKKNHDSMEKAAKNAYAGKRSDIIKKSNATARDAAAGKYGSYGKRVMGEGFDPVYEDLCRMGIIG